MPDSSDLFQYIKDPDDDHEGVSRAVYQIEIDRLGLEQSSLLFPGNNTDIHISLKPNEVPFATFRSKIFVIGGEDMQGNKIPKLLGMRYFQQNWEVGGSYLDPVETDGQSIA